VPEPPRIRNTLDADVAAYREAGMPYGPTVAGLARWARDRKRDQRRRPMPGSDPRLVRPL
jgi:hypothetical protein